tara:strand:+ start:947 stop:2023 length:1077 start_codon:yes stop_codon:yes gene_type:complete
MSKMNQIEKEVCVARLLSGVVYAKNPKDGKEYLIKQPSSLDMYLAQMHYNDVYNTVTKSGVMTEEQFVDILLNEKLWTHEEEYRLDELPDRIEDAKVNLFESYANYKSRENIRARLKALRKEQSTLIKKKSIYKQESAESFADASRLKFEVFSGITDMDGKRLFKGKDYLKQDDFFCNFLVATYLGSMLLEEQVREISRTEPWRSFWGVGKSENGVFDKPSSELTSMQRAVISWARIYDSIGESPEAPPEEVVEDNDMLDGWLILQHRRRKSASKSQAANSSTKAKGDEVYLFADSQDDARRIYELNDRTSRGHIRQRQKEIDNAAKRGETLPVEKTTEAQLEMRRMSNEKFKSAVKS